MDLNLVVPFTKDAIKKAEKMKMSVINPDDNKIKLTKNILISIMKGDFEFPELDEKYMQDYYAFYPFARIILSHANKDKFYREFSKFYYKETKKNIKHFDKTLDLLEIDFQKRGKYYCIPFETFIRARVYSDKDKLTNQFLHKGFVYLNPEKTLNFIARFVSTRVVENLPLDTKNTSKLFETMANEINTIFKPKINKYNLKNKAVKTENFPPCMQNILNTILEHGKPSHMERYYFATFCFTIKMQLEDILNIFRNTSDFNENITKYQLEKIKTYAGPKCVTLKSMGLCYQDDFCNNINSPVGYYFKKSYKAENSKEQKD